MKLFLKRILYFSLGIAPFFLSIIAYNVIIDPYGVLVGDMGKQINEPNQHYLKVKHLLQNPKKYDSYFIGSSRVGKIDTRNIKDNNRWYNLSYSEALPRESLTDLKTLLENGVTIKNIVMGLDNISYETSPKKHLKQSLRKPYTNRSYFEYLLLRPSIKILKKKLSGEENVIYDIYNSGVPIVLHQDEWINSNKELHINDPKFSKPISTSHYDNRTKETMIEMEEIIKICEENNIRLTLFINPMHIKTYLNLKIDEYLEFLSLLVRLKTFYDFSGINEITSNNYNFYETSHFRPHIGEMIKADILNNSNKISSLVTLENVKDIMKIKRNEFEMYRRIDKE